MDHLVGSVSLFCLWMELMKNLSPAAKSQLCHGHLDHLTAAALLHLDYMGPLNNPTICYHSSMDHLVGLISLLWMELMLLLWMELMKNLSPAAKSEPKVSCSMAIWTTSLLFYCFILSIWVH
jgi:hypothetical protein